MTDSFEFDRWLMEAHPEVQLLPHQREWIRHIEQGHQVVSMGMASGKTFMMKLYREYKAFTVPVEELEKTWFV